MARRSDGDDDIEALLEQARRTLSGESSGPPATRDERSATGLRGRVRSAAVSSAVAGGVVWFVFAVLPFLRATSGAVGAFLATFVVLLVLGGRRG